MRIFEKEITDNKIEDTIIRVDNIKYKTAYDLYNMSLGLFWTMKMINMDGDRQSFDKLPDNIKKLFLINNSYQMDADSKVTNIFPLLADFANTSELSLLYNKIAFDESIHAESYSSGLVSMFGNNSTRVIDDTLQDPMLQDRLKSEIDYGMKLKHSPTFIDIFKALLSIYYLENLKFPFSFFITLNISHSYEALSGFGEMISRISLDEMQVHAPTGLFVIREMINDHELGDYKKIIIEMASYVLENELKWNEYLSGFGTCKGYNQEIGERFIKFRHNKCLRALGIDVKKLEEPLQHQWFEDYRNPDNQLVSQQESGSSSYQKGVLLNDL